jgi:hypothetical protein
MGSASKSFAKASPEESEKDLPPFPQAFHAAACRRRDQQQQGQDNLDRRPLPTLDPGPVSPDEENEHADEEQDQEQAESFHPLPLFKVSIPENVPESRRAP